MWFRRIFRRRRRPPPLALDALDRLEELVARVAELLGELPLDAPARAGENPLPAVVPEPTRPPGPAACVLFQPTPEGYRLLERPHEPPAAGERIELDGAAYLVLRLGPSPLPDDHRRCAFLERSGRAES